MNSFRSDEACHDPHLGGLETGKADPTIVDHGDHHHHKKSAGTSLLAVLHVRVRVCACA
jgi:hypothetical protein